MKKTDKKLKSKGIETNIETGYYQLRYNRNFVAKKHKEVNFLPFSRGSSQAWLCVENRSNVCLYQYLRRYSEKQDGRKVDEVFRDFSKLGWKSSIEMYYYWDLLY